MPDQAQQNSKASVLSRPFRRFILPSEFAEIQAAVAVLPDPRFLLQINSITAKGDPAELFEAARDHLLIWNAFWRKQLRLTLGSAGDGQPRICKASIAPARKKMLRGDFSDRGDRLDLVRASFAFSCAQFGHRLMTVSVQVETPEQALAAVRLRLLGLSVSRRKRNLFGIKSHTRNISPLRECYAAMLMLPFHFSQRHRGGGEWAPRRVRGQHDTAIQRVIACADTKHRPLSDRAQKSLIHLLGVLYRMQRDRAGARPALNRKEIKIRFIPRLLSVFEEILAEEFGVAPASVIDVVPSEDELLPLLRRRLPTLEITNRRIAKPVIPRIARPVAPPRPKRNPFSIIRPESPTLPAINATAVQSLEHHSPKAPVVTPTLPSSNPHIASSPAPSPVPSTVRFETPKRRRKDKAVRPATHAPARRVREPSKPKKRRTKQEIDALRARAIELVARFPDLSKTEIAKKMGVSPAFLSRPDDFAETFERTRQASVRDARRHASIDSRTGRTDFSER